MMMRRGGSSWSATALTEDKLVGPKKVPSTRNAAADLEEFWKDINMDTPYEGAYAFLVALCRKGLMPSSAASAVTEGMFLKVLHKDCLVANDKLVKIRRHTKSLITKVGRHTVRSLFEGADPTNEYEVGMGEALTVRFAPGSPYRNYEGAKHDVEIHCNGVEPLHVKTRRLQMAFADGVWKVRVFAGILSDVVEPFDEYEKDPDKLLFESEFRQWYALPPKAKPKAKKMFQDTTNEEYLANVRSENGITKVDLEATRRRLAREAEEAKIAAMTPEEREAYEEEKRLAAIERQEKARRETAELAGRNALRSAGKKRE